MIVRNAAQCAFCGIVLESFSRHDFKQHTCTEAGKISVEYDYDLKKTVPAYPYFAVDGGKDYRRLLYGRREDFIDLSEETP